MSDYFNLWDQELQPTVQKVRGDSLVSSPVHDQEMHRELDVAKELLSYSWPGWFKEFRSNQLDAIERVMDAYTRTNVVLLDAPTGTGKTLIAEAVRKLLKAKKSLYVCSGLQLQDQFTRDFDVRTIKGRSNYPTELFDYPRYSAADCNKQPGNPTSCMFCSRVENCAYEKAKREALAANVACLNTTYLLYEANSAGRFSGREFITLDECDLVESELMRYAEFKVSAKQLDLLGLEPPGKGVRKATIVQWLQESLLPAVAAKLQELGRESETVELVREVKKWTGLMSATRTFLIQLEGDGENFVREYADSGQDTQTGDTLTSFHMKPVTVSEYGPKLLLHHADKWLLMSGTIISAEAMARDLGITDFELVSVPMGFPVENRPVVYAPVADMVYKKEFVEREKLKEAVRVVCREHEGENILVHTNSYKLTRYLYFELRDEVKGLLSYSEARYRDQTLEKFRRNGGVLLAPSMERGIDLPDELCTVQIIAKLPYPSLQDRQISTRLHTPGGQLWYDVSTVRTVIQMAGRGVRHEGDFCLTYVLDKQFGSLRRKVGGLIPGYFIEGLGYGMNKYRDVYKELVK